MPAYICPYPVYVNRRYVPGGHVFYASAAPNAACALATAAQIVQQQSDDAKALDVWGPYGVGVVTGIYNYNASYLANWRAARDAAKANTANANVVFMGDSTDAGTGTTKPFTQVAATVTNLQALGYSITNEGFYATHGYNSPEVIDTHLTRGAGWATSGGALSGFAGNAFLFANNATVAALSYTPYTPVDTWDIDVIGQSGGPTLTIAANGTTIGTINTSFTAGTVQRFTFTVPLGVQTLSITPTANAGTNVQLLGAMGRIAANKVITVYNAGISGATISRQSTPYDTGLDYQPLTRLGELAPKLTIINLTINDWNAATDVPTYTTQMQALITKAKLSGDVLLMSGNPSNPNSGGDASYAQQTIYRNVMKSLAASNNCVGIDLTDRQVSWEQNNANGWTLDALHLVTAGYADIAAAITQVLAM